MQISFITRSISTRPFFLRLITSTVILICLPSHGSNQSHQIDSLKKLLEYQSDTAKIRTLAALSWELRNSEPLSAIEYGTLAIEKAEKYMDFEALAMVHGYVGVAYRITGNYSKSTDYFYKGLEISQKHNLAEQQGYAFINIANLLIYQEYYNSAFENLKKADEIARKIKNFRMLSYVYLNYGRGRLLTKEFDQALTDLTNALLIRKDIGFTQGLPVCYKYIGDIYFELQNFNDALINYDEALRIVKKDLDKDLYANILVRKAEIYCKKGNINLAQKFATEALRLAQSIGARLTIRDALKVSAQTAKIENNFKTASQSFEKIINYNDTLFNQQLSEKLFFLEYQYEKQKKETEIELLNNEKIIKELQLNRQFSINITLIAFILLFIILFVIILISLKHRKDKNQQLEAQNEEIIKQQQNIEIKNKHLEDAYRVIERYISKITDNIKYAERIQKAIMPSLSMPQGFFTESFCFYKPKDFVSGDFYWFVSKNDSLFFAVADCTGHGVPGAFMSIIGLDMLNQAVNQSNLSEPSAILEFINSDLPKRMNSSENVMVLKDAMDIAVCRYDRETMVLHYSSALIPVLICRNELIHEHKPSPVSIGISKKIYSKKFAQNSIQLQKNDWIYISTDGYIDQFGGSTGQKYYRKRLYSSLAENSQLNSRYQQMELERTFLQWQGKNEQVDDVLVLGLKL